MDKIQMTEEQARDIFDKCVFSGCGTPLNIFLASLEDEGYIKGNPVEEAKKFYQSYLNKNFCHETLNDIFFMETIEKLYKAIEYLEAKK